METLLAILACAAVAFDIGTTAHAFMRGGFKEVSWIYRRFSKPVVLIVRSGVLIFVIWFARYLFSIGREKSAYLLLLAAIASGVTGALVNFRNLSKERKK